MVYVGPLGENSRELITYFEDMPDTVHIRPGYNPATWMLEVIGAGVGSNSDVDYAQVFATSERRKALMEQLTIEGVASPSPDYPELIFEGKRASSAQEQAKQLLLRFSRLYWRTPAYNMTRMFLQIFLGVLFGTVCYDTDYTTFQGINSGLGMVFVSAVFIGVAALNSVLPVAVQERAAYYRERSAETYNAYLYSAAFALIEIPYTVVAAFFFNIIFFPLVGFTGVDTFIWYWFVSSLLVLNQIYFGQLLAFALPSVEVASLAAALMTTIQFLFMGFNPPESQIPSGYTWLYYLSTPRYAFAALAASVFGECSDGTELGCSIITDTPPTMGATTMKQYAIANFNIDVDDATSQVGALVGFLVLFHILSFLSLRYINHQKH